MNVLEFLAAICADRVAGRAWVLNPDNTRTLVAENLNDGMVLTEEGEAMRATMNPAPPKARTKRKTRGALAPEPQNAPGDYVAGSELAEVGLDLSDLDFDGPEEQNTV